MALRRRSTRRRPIRRRRPARRSGRRSGRRMNPMAMGCKVVEVEEFSATGANVGGIVTSSLIDYPRALRLSGSYKYYRCEKVEIEFIPRFNTFQGSDGGISKPELYYQTNKQLLATAPTKTIMQSRGCSPIQWTKTVKKSFRPAIMRGESLYTLNSNVSVVTAWNPTAANVAQITPAGSFNPGSGTVSGIPEGAGFGNTTGNLPRFGFYQAQTPVHGKWYATQQAATSLPGASQNAVALGAGPTNLVYYGAEYFITVPGSESDSAFVSGRIVVKTTWGFKGARSTLEVNAAPPS